MIPQPQYSIKDKYALIHYIRESLVKKNNPKQYFEVNEEYLALLPQAFELQGDGRRVARFGFQTLSKDGFWHGFVLDLSSEQGRSPADWNIAQKGIAVRLDKGPEVFPREILDPLR